jgi:hypothetical protein
VVKRLEGCRRLPENKRGGKRSGFAVGSEIRFRDRLGVGIPGGYSKGLTKRLWSTPGASEACRAGKLLEASPVSKARGQMPRVKGPVRSKLLVEASGWWRSLSTADHGFL